jgi:hypothetical protein
MTKLLSIYELNSYSRLVYDNKKSTLDAAFELLLNPYYSEKITSNTFKNQTAKFILYIYTIVYLQLLNDCDNNMLYLSGNNNDFKLFAYNIIYFYDNQYDEYDEYNKIDYQQETICSNDIFYYIISQYLSNCNVDEDNNNINGYKTTITDFINDNYDYDELIELNDTHQVEDWEIYIYVICYNYICLFQDIKNDAFVPIYLSNIKHYLNSCIIVYCMNIIIKKSTDNPDINQFLDKPENKYFSDIIDSVQAIFYDENDIRFKITNCPELFEGEKILETIFDYVINYYTYKPAINTKLNGEISVNKPITEIIIKKFMLYQYYLCEKLRIKEDNFEKTINDIKLAIRNHCSLKQFYGEFLNKITINSDKIDLIKKEENIYLLNKNFQECFYSLILKYHNKKNDNNYINKIFTNLCDDINNINLNYKLNKKIKEINQGLALNKGLALDNYFFNNFNIHFKLQQIENYQNSNTDETEYCDAFYFPKSLSLQRVNYVDDLEGNITMGLFNLSEKNSPPIKLETTVLFDTNKNDVYCGMNYILEKNLIVFVT